MNLFGFALYFSVLAHCCWAVSYQCKGLYFHKSEGSIIRTEDSIANGAIALKSLPTESLKNCEISCCNHHSCNVAIYETTVKNLCYLFDCGPDARFCEFKHHSRYAVSIKVRRKSFKHIAGELDIKIATSRPTSGTPSTVKPSQVARQIRSRQQCPYPPDVQFPCHNANKFPSCIAVYDRCDGVPQCGDASDEAGCPSSKDSHVRQGGPPPPPPSPPPPQPRESLSASLADRYHQARATVIGLGVALALTLVAIVALGCRLRQLRARFGAGGQSKLRSRMVDDEDYLINGMYL